MFQKLNFPDYAMPLRQNGSKTEIWDTVRKKWLIATPEEWVRQHWVHHLINSGFPETLIGIEKQFNLNGLNKRFDIMAGHPPLMLIECKAPEIPITQKTFDQISRYNTLLKVPYLVISNGLHHLFFKLNEDFSAVSQLNEFPAYAEMKISTK